MAKGDGNMRIEALQEIIKAAIEHDQRMFEDLKSGFNLVREERDLFRRRAEKAEKLEHVREAESSEKEVTALKADRDRMKSRAQQLEDELSGYKTVMACGHCRDATVVEDPPYCGICRIIKERDDWKDVFDKLSRIVLGQRRG